MVNWSPPSSRCARGIYRLSSMVALYLMPTSRERARPSWGFITSWTAGLSSLWAGFIPHRHTRGWKPEASILGARTVVRRKGLKRRRRDVRGRREDKEKERGRDEASVAQL